MSERGWVQCEDNRCERKIRSVWDFCPYCGQAQGQKAFEEREAEFEARHSGEDEIPPHTGRKLITTTVIPLR